MTDSRSALFHHVVRVETTLWNLLDAEVRRRHGLSQGRVEVLHALRELEESDEVGLADAMSVPVTRIHRFVQWLELAGLSERRGADHDSFGVTPAGEALLLEVAKTTEQVLGDLLGHAVSDQELAAATQMFARISRRLGQASALTDEMARAAS